MVRERVTRDRAIATAVALADRGGLASLSMRKLAAELGIEAMSLYTHVRSKDDLVDGMVDVVHAEILSPTPGDPWRAAMAGRARSMREVLARHPWAISALDSRRSPGPANLGRLDAVIGCLRAAGFSMPLVGHTMSILDSYVQGFAMQEAALPTDEQGDIGDAAEAIMAQQTAMAEQFPHLTEMATTLILTPGYAYGAEFDFGLELILDGIESARARE